MRAALSIARKEFNDLAREKVYIVAFFVQLFLVVGVIFVSTLYTSVSSPEVMGQYIPQQEIKVGVYGRDIDFQGVEEVRLSTPESGLKERGLVAKVVFPPDFSQDLQEGKKTRVTLLLDNTNVLSGYANARVEEGINSLEKDARVEIARERGLEKEDVFNPVALEVKGLEEGSYPPDFIQLMYGILIPFILLLPTFIASNMTTDLIVGEKENRTYELLVSAPLSRREIILGKALPVASVALVEAFLWMRVLESRQLPVHNEPFLLAYLLVLDILFIAFGIAISAVSESVRDANSVVTFLLLAASFVFFAPVAIESSLQSLSP